MLINRCLDCQHRSICKYKVDYEKVLSDVPIAVSSPFKLILDCEYYFNNNSYYSLNQCGSQYRNTVAYGNASCCNSTCDKA